MNVDQLFQWTEETEIMKALKMKSLILLFDTFSKLEVYYT